MHHVCDCTGDGTPCFYLEELGLQDWEVEKETRRKEDCWAECVEASEAPLAMAY